ncbi:hypothetical protein KY092_12750 [Natronomonas gomsonensis]|uniref:hypothetical protein n=1 Tax=Natronomonas gomsonensis TaxID=1046043 RepID=UPI0020CA8BB9|nr:hypothetical protein [Natronomonas gomsonensis]MCY4731421.1 hypothetical protein [Natronomonas gomsonensis]
MNTLKVLGVLAVATSVVLLASGTGSFTAANADRTTALSVADDESALVGFEVSCEEKTVRHGPRDKGPDNHLVDADLGGNESAGNDDDGVDADIFSESSAGSDNDLVDANVFANESAESDNDLVGVDIGSKGITVDSSPSVSTRAELTVTVTNRFARPLEGTVTVDGTTKDVGPILPGRTDEATFEGSFEAGDPITINVTKPITATLNRSVPEDCKHATDDPKKGISFVALCGVSLDADLNVSVVNWDGGDPTAIRWESNGSVEVVVTKAGSRTGTSTASGPGIQNHPVGDSLSGIVDAFGTDSQPEQTPQSPCPDGIVGVKFDFSGASSDDGEKVGS